MKRIISEPAQRRRGKVAAGVDANVPTLLLTAHVHVHVLPSVAAFTGSGGEPPSHRGRVTPDVDLRHYHLIWSRGAHTSKDPNSHSESEFHPQSSAALSEPPALKQLWGRAGGKGEPP